MYNSALFWSTSRLIFAGILLDLLNNREDGRQ